MAGLELKGRVVRREADSHRTLNFGENWAVWRVDGDTKARDCFAWGNAEFHLPPESDVTPVCACEGQYRLVLVREDRLQTQVRCSQAGWLSQPSLSSLCLPSLAGFPSTPRPWHMPLSVTVATC